MTIYSNGMYAVSSVSMPLHSSLCDSIVSSLLTMEMEFNTELGFTWEADISTYFWILSLRIVPRTLITRPSPSVNYFFFPLAPISNCMANSGSPGVPGSPDDWAVAPQTLKPPVKFPKEFWVINYDIFGGDLTRIAILFYSTQQTVV